ncbi:hypothetical protein [Glutamicibacter halophytocola]|uniref:hypothetical protein n=1 Tax=Glutamicibacter halophytocola TaxID=1933880 RepID=UPI001892CF35|nr:hypothetical protein [Glutamicibacter halophytocola]
MATIESLEAELASIFTNEEIQVDSLDLVDIDVTDGVREIRTDFSESLMTRPATK